MPSANLLRNLEHSSVVLKQPRLVFMCSLGVLISASSPSGRRAWSPTCAIWSAV